MAIEAQAACVFYIGASVDEGYGTPFFRAFNLQLPLGEIHQIHGKGVGQREVFMTLNQEIQASRLIAGLTWGGNGAWTSWPPRGHGMLIFGYWQPTHMRAVVTIWRYWIPGGNR